MKKSELKPSGSLLDMEDVPSGLNSPMQPTSPAEDEDESEGDETPKLLSDDSVRGLFFLCGFPQETLNCRCVTELATSHRVARTKTRKVPLISRPNSSRKEQNHHCRPLSLWVGVQLPSAISPVFW